VLLHMGKATLANGIGEPALQHLVTVLGLQDRWDLPVEQNCALWSELPQVAMSIDKDSLFDRLFNAAHFVLLDGAWPKNTVKFIHPSFRQAGAPSPADNTLHRLLGALQVSDEQLVILIQNLSRPLGVDLSSSNESDRGVLLTLANLTLLYRAARLAHLLQLAVPDRFPVIRLAGIASGHIAVLASLVTLLGFYDWWKASGFSLDDLGFVTHGPVQQTQAYPDPQTMATQVVA